MIRVRFASTKAAQLPLPRFIRRHPPPSLQLAPDGSSLSFRSKHFDPARQTTPKSDLRLLEPHVLSSRIQKLCDSGKVNDAVYMLKNAPLDAQNTPVWNTMMWEALKAGKHALAYQLFVDMKRRGFSPTTRTFKTLFNGFARIDNWVFYSKQLSNVRSLYELYQRYLASVKRHDPTSAELSIEPAAGYIRILGAAGEYQSIFDVYYSLDQDGPLAPNQLVFTALFQALHSAMGDTVEGREKVAPDARLVWKQMVKAAKSNKNCIPDSQTATSAIICLSGGKEPDVELAFDIVAEYYGLKANQTSPPTPLCPLHPSSLSAILRLCNMSKRHDTCLQFYEQIRRQSGGGQGILDTAHMEEILRANIALKEPGLGAHALQTLEWMLREEITGSMGPKIRPTLSTYNLVLQACHADLDFASARRVFDLLTGYHTHDFMDGSQSDSPRLDKRGHGKNFTPSAEFVSLLLRIAAESRNKAHIRLVLRIVHHIGYDKITSCKSSTRDGTKALKHRNFFNAKFASVVADSVDQLLASDGKFVKPEEVEKFAALGRKARGQEELAPTTRPRHKTKPRRTT